MNLEAFLIISSIMFSIGLIGVLIKSNITFGLSGGYDSRIILGLFPNNYKKKIKTVTIGDKYSLEKISAKKVASLLKVYHLDLKIKKDFYLKDPSKILNYGNYNNIFKNGTKEEIYSKIFKKNKSNFFIQGNALDVLIASSFSIKKLLLHQVRISQNLSPTIPRLTQPVLIL